jgi:hypothetical protein
VKRIKVAKDLIDLATESMIDSAYDNVVEMSE